MRVRGASLLLGCACALAACIFHLDGVLLTDADLGMTDLGTDDGPTLELGPPDLSEDLADQVDFSGVDFTTPPIDLAGADLTPPVAGFPSHVAYHYLVDSAADWTVVENTTINTTMLSISSPTPAGLILTIDGPYTVLALRNLNVGTQMKPDVRLQIVGTRPLVIVAGEQIHVYGLIDAGAHADVPGPAGARPANGDGAGTSAPIARGGGGGAGHGSIGGGGGANPATPAGLVYDDAMLTLFEGGSGGGAGKAATGPLAPSCVSPASGGGGGGVLQLSARSILIESSASGARGTLSVGGGGGAGGCGVGIGGGPGGGGGGGSGGSLLIEAPSMTLGGRIVAPGGGGGGGGSIGPLPLGIDLTSGAEGFDGFVAALPGLSSFGGLGTASGGKGYNGITAPPAAAQGGGWSDIGNWGGGGGGAGAGRIRIRSSTAQNPMNTTPPPSVAVDLPATIP
jgi:hypothetical protein